MRHLFLIFGLFVFSFSLFAQIEEKYVDFPLSSSVIDAGESHLGLEWLSPGDFLKTNLSVMDLPQVSSLNPGNNQIIAAKLAFQSEKSFNDFSFESMNNATFISHMLSSVNLSQKSSGSWLVTNKVKAYGIPFKVNFELTFKELDAKSISKNVVAYFRREADVSAGAGRERFLLLDMTRFSQLMYRNYCIVYLKELGNSKTLIVAGLIASFDLKAANSYFNYPPFSSTHDTMMGNLRTQMLNMVKSIR